MKLPRPIRAPARRLLSRIAERDPATGRPLQVAALPWRRAPDGSLEVLLVTGRRSSRWIVPKGWPMRGRTPAQAAAREAYEEAGLEGDVEAREIGRFDHVKNHPLLGRLRTSVLLFPMTVTGELEAWPEKGQRGRRWFAREAAAKRVASPELARLILRFDPGTAARKARPEKAAA
ncbi:MAG TPA: NUDIX hydrolase [Allosphingosinicella sp.]|nr:NUDIX hydrolase [Allosphingosinicella sp.]